MAKVKEEKTNVMRLLEGAHLPYQMHYYDAPDGALSGVEVAQQLSQDPDHVFKTLVTTGASGKHYVFMIPVAEELSLKKAAAAAKEKAHVQVRGLMTIPPFDADRDTNIQYFKKVRALYVDINAKLFHNELEYLSMGMSDDYPIAIGHGSTLIRVGSKIFGARIY